MNLLKDIHRLAAVKIWAVTFMLCVAAASVSYGQYEIGKEFIEQRAREFHSLKHKPEGRWAFSKKYKTWNPKDGIVLSSISLRDGYWPEIEVTFSKKRVSIGDRIIVKAKRRLHPGNKEGYETRFDKYKEEGLPVRIGSDMTMIDSISVPRKPDKYNHVWMYPGEEMAFEYEVHDNMKHYRTKSQHVTLSVGGGRFGELRHYFIYPAGVDTTVKKLHRFGPKRIKVDTNRQKYRSPGYYGTVENGSSKNIPSANINNDEKPTASYLMRKANSSNNEVTINGTLKYFDDEITQANKPIKNVVLRIYKSNHSNDLLTPITTFTYKDYPISTDGNGNFTETVTILEDFFRPSYFIKKQTQSGHSVYEGFVFDNGELITIEHFFNTGPGAVFETSSSDTIDIASTLEFVDSQIDISRRLAAVADHLDNGLETINTSTSNDIETMQTIKFATYISNIPTSSSSIHNSSQGISLIEISSDPFFLKPEVILHEFGHTLQFAAQNFNFIPDVGGNHYLDGKNHPRQAFVEGWANFVAAHVLNDADVFNTGVFSNSSLDLENSTYDNYIYGDHYTGFQKVQFFGGSSNGLTPYDGFENEGMVASAFWSLRGFNGNNFQALWNGLLGKFNNRIIFNTLEYFLVNSTTKTIFYNNNRSEELGFGTDLKGFDAFDNIAQKIPAEPDNTVFYLSNGIYDLTEQIVIDEISYGIFGESTNNVILDGIPNNNTIAIVRSNIDNDFVKISDLTLENGLFGIDVLAPNYPSNQGNVHVSRIISRNNKRGLCFSGNAILTNSVIIGNNASTGIYLPSLGSLQSLFIYNNVIDNVSKGIVLANEAELFGRISNNVFSNNEKLFDIESTNLGDQSDLKFIKNIYHNSPLGNSSTINVAQAENYQDNPNYSGFFYLDKFYNDSGIRVTSTNENDPFFDDRITGNFAGDFNYGDTFNYVGLYGGQMAYFAGSSDLPQSSNMP